MALKLAPYQSHVTIITLDVPRQLNPIRASHLGVILKPSLPLMSISAPDNQGQRHLGMALLTANIKAVTFIAP
jgi:hypothetical protein